MSTISKDKFENEELNELIDGTGKFIQGASDGKNQAETGSDITTDKAVISVRQGSRYGFNNGDSRSLGGMIRTTGSDVSLGDDNLRMAAEGSEEKMYNKLEDALEDEETLEDDTLPLANDKITEKLLFDKKNSDKVDKKSLADLVKKSLKDFFEKGNTKELTNAKQ